MFDSHYQIIFLSSTVYFSSLQFPIFQEEGWNPLLLFLYFVFLCGMNEEILDAFEIIKIHV